MNLLDQLIGPSQVVALFFCGRSGSHLLQSFFDGHPQVLTVPPSSIEWLEDVSLTAMAVSDGFVGVSAGVSPEIFGDSMRRQMDVLQAAGKLWTPELMLKALFIARRMASGLPIDLTRPLTFLWSAHTPTMQRKRWILDTFEDPKLLTIVRFPEKAFDSHLMHHAFETVSDPLSSLVRRLLIDHMAQSADVAGDGTRERAVRFEDLHGDCGSVLEALGNWLGVDPPSAHNDFCHNVRGKSIVGVRKLTRSEYEPKLLNHFDKLKVRHLLQENYRAWGYDQMILGGLDASLAEYASEPVAAVLDFSAQALLDDSENEEESESLEQALIAERRRRDAGIRLTPLLKAAGD